ncbi:MAG: phosphoribosylanthranilate isomerase [Oscillospiraceae bacterium]|nr:phosphoribosylanthranilate isomerase [Oscillospiraceae bacterium]
MTRIKLCGLRRPIDAEIANACLPDYIGFVFAASPRRVSSSEAAEIAINLNPGIRKVGVFVGTEPKEVAGIVDSVGLDVVQLHFDTTPEYNERLRRALPKSSDRKIEVWQRIAVPLEATEASDVLERIIGYPPVESFDALVFDVITDKRDGGSGIPFPWKAGMAAAKVLRVMNSRIIIAGGIGPHNVRQAIEYFSPFAVDVSGSVETDGYKDRDKVAELIRAVRGGVSEHE